MALYPNPDAGGSGEHFGAFFDVLHRAPGADTGGEGALRVPLLQLPDVHGL